VKKIPAFLAQNWWWLLPMVLVGAGTLFLLLQGPGSSRIGIYTPW
jgi:hypothetical protein